MIGATTPAMTMPRDHYVPGPRTPAAKAEFGAPAFAGSDDDLSRFLDRYLPSPDR